jgi:chromosome segregation ATPase
MLLAADTSEPSSAALNVALLLLALAGAAAYAVWRFPQLARTLTPLTQLTATKQRATRKSNAAQQLKTYEDAAQQMLAPIRTYDAALADPNLPVSDVKELTGLVKDQRAQLAVQIREIKQSMRRLRTRDTLDTHKAAAARPAKGRLATALKDKQSARRAARQAKLAESLEPLEAQLRIAEDTLNELDRFLIRANAKVKGTLV